jgi:hypothetical protein
MDSAQERSDALERSPFEFFSRHFERPVPRDRDPQVSPWSRVDLDSPSDSPRSSSPRTPRRQIRASGYGVKLAERRRQLQTKLDQEWHALFDEYKHIKHRLAKERDREIHTMEMNDPLVLLGFEREYNQRRLSAEDFAHERWLESLMD